MERSALQPAAAADPRESAKVVGLKYVLDSIPGIRRIKTGNSFRYVDPAGRPIRDPEELLRIKSLAIPPAWTDIWISPDPKGHLQATGRDGKGRKQYRYHPRWRELRDETKYARMIAFGKALPKIRQQVQQDLATPALPRKKVLAAVVRLLEISLIRIGNEEYAKQNRSFGLTTMLDQHVRISGPKVRFRFRGKSGKEHELEIHDSRLARVVKNCRDIPGQHLFQYVDDNGERQSIQSGDVNDYLREITGDEFTAKDFRTWAGTVLAAVALREFERVDSQAKAKRNIMRAIEAVAQMLGNTPSICRKCYVHPVVIDAYLDGSIRSTVRRRAESAMNQSLGQLRPEEAAVLALLQRRLVREG